MKLTKHPLLLSGPHLSSVPVDQSVIRKLEVSFGLLEGRADEFTRRFYEQLFALHPAVRGMFPADMTKQREKLFDSLRSVVKFLREPDKEMEMLSGLGKRHAEYGARPEHYVLVVELMVKSMEAAGGNAWLSEYSQEWNAALRLVSEIMVKAGPPQAGTKTA